MKLKSIYELFIYLSDLENKLLPQGVQSKAPLLVDPTIGVTVWEMLDFPDRAAVSTLIDTALMSGNYANLSVDDLAQLLAKSDLTPEERAAALRAYSDLAENQDRALGF